MHVLFVEPLFPRNQRDFARALHAVGARVTGIGETPVDGLDHDLRTWLDGYEQVPSVVHEGALHDAVRRVQEREWVDRLEATVEAHILPAARVREACGIPGTSVRTAFLCRDKPAMKDVLREAGVPCAQSAGARSAQEVWAFAEAVGFPVILKPRDAAGAAGTHRANGPEELDAAIRATGVDRGASVAVEEFVEGHEGFYDTLSIDGHAVHEFVSHYYPNVLEGMRERWISPQVAVTNRLDAPDYQEVRELARRVHEAFGIETSATHMEWFFGPKGLRFSEIGCRPPGVRIWDLYSIGNDLDLYVEWAKAVAYGHTEARASRRFATGLIALRPERDGVVAGYEGWDQVQRDLGEHIVDNHLPSPGEGTQPIEGGYLANAWVRVRHPDYDELRRLMNTIGQTVRVRVR